MTTPLMRTTLVMGVVAMWCLVQFRWSLLSKPTLLPQSPSRSIRSSSLDTAELEEFPREKYSYTTDERLLQDAFEAARRVPASAAVNPKIAFLFLVRGEIPFESLWRRFFAGHEQRYSLYVHTAPNFTFPRSSFFYGKQIPSHAVERLSRSLADAVRRLVAMALVDGTNHNAWFVNLCEATIPLRSFDDTYNYLTRSRHSFVQSFQPVTKYWGAVPHFSHDELRKGEVWMALRRRHAVMIVADRAIYAVFGEQCHKNCHFDERYFQTLLHLKDPAGLANRTTMFVDWSGKKVSSPRSFDARTTNASLLDEIVQLTEDSIYGQHYNTAFQKFGTVQCAYNGVAGAPCFLFARKFQPSARDAAMEWFSTSQSESQMRGIRLK